MRRLVLAGLLCTAMLGAAVFLFMPVGLAQGLFPTPRQNKSKAGIIETLLELPAPPPSNPLFVARPRDAKFYDKQNPPPDDAPIDDLVDYWTMQSSSYRQLGYNIRPSDKVLDRLMAEVDARPELAVKMLHSFRDSQRAADLIRRIYERQMTDRTLGREERNELRSWLTYNHPQFSGGLVRGASQVRDVNEYVSNQDELLALTRNDFEQAKPIVNRLYADPTNRVSQVLAKWALYRHALDSDSIGDIDRYRDELKAVVEDRNATPGMRDLALDALVKEKEWPGRDDWYFTLLEDETLAELRVNGQVYTGLTTILYFAPPEKYVPKMIALLDSSNIHVRSAAVRNLLLLLSQHGPNPDIVRALLPWLENPKWARALAEERRSIVDALQQIAMPESVPGLIAVLDEKETVKVPDYSSIGNAANAATAAANAAATVMNTAATASNSNRYWNYNSETYSGPTKTETRYPYRDSAVSALAMQKDNRAAPALRRLITQTVDHRRLELIRAIVACNGFAVSEMLDALEHTAKRGSEITAAVEAGDQTAAMELLAEMFPESYGTVVNARPRAAPSDIRMLLGMTLVATPDAASEALVRATIDRIEVLDEKDPRLAEALRDVILAWKGTAVSALLLRDLRNGRGTPLAAVKLLTERKVLREKLPGDVADLRSGTAAARGLAACLEEDPASYDKVLDSNDVEEKTALLACARLIRAPLPIAKVSVNVRTPNKLLNEAAELYLVSDDSAEARDVVLGHHPGEAVILGSAIAFPGRGGRVLLDPMTAALFASVHEGFVNQFVFDASNEKHKDVEERLRKEVREDADILGVYSYANNFVRIYKDRVVFSWEDDPSRYRERVLTAEEFARIKEHLATHRAEELKPFLACFRPGECESEQLLMLGRNGGRRVFFHGDRKPEFFAGLDRIFADLKIDPAVLKYSLARSIPGLEIMFADDDLNAETVWKNGTDLRVLLSSTAARKKVDNEVAEIAEEEEPDEVPGEPSIESTIYKVRAQREYEGYAWHRFENGRLGEAVAQPAGVEFIPLRDGLAVASDSEQWKSRGAGFEIRADAEGLYRISGGKLTRLKAGNYERPVISSSGKWLAVSKYDETEGMSLVRINLVTGKEYVVAFDDFPYVRVRSFVPAAGKFLLAGVSYDHEHNDDSEDGEDDNNDGRQRFFLMDPDTGIVTPAPGDARPLSEQTFRPLQATARAGEFWAAVRSGAKNETAVGRYDSKAFKFTPVLRIPRIAFDSMDMWVDETEKRLFFVYNGHLLSLPLPL